MHPIQKYVSKDNNDWGAGDVRINELHMVWPQTSTSWYTPVSRCFKLSLVTSVLYVIDCTIRQIGSMLTLDIEMLFSQDFNVICYIIRRKKINLVINPWQTAWIYVSVFVYLVVLPPWHIWAKGMIGTHTCRHLVDTTGRLCACLECSDFYPWSYP